jgi:hypothetical protein
MLRLELLNVRNHCAPPEREFKKNFRRYKHAAPTELAIRFVADLCRAEVRL